MVGVVHSYAGERKVVANRMIDVYHSSQVDYDQQRILKEFAKSDSTIRCVTMVKTVNTQKSQASWVFTLTPCFTLNQSILNFEIWFLR